MSERKPVTYEFLKKTVLEMKARSQGYFDGKAYDMSEPREPRFEDDFFNEPSDDDPYEQYDWQQLTLDSIAIEKGHEYAKAIANNRAFYVELKEAYKAGFLEGFAHRFTQPTIEREEE